MPVSEAPEGDAIESIVGAISEKGLLDRAYRDPSVVERTVGEVMDRPLPTIDVAATLADAFGLLIGVGLGAPGGPGRPPGRDRHQARPARVPRPPRRLSRGAPAGGAAAAARRRPCRGRGPTSGRPWTDVRPAESPDGRVAAADRRPVGRMSPTHAGAPSRACSAVDAHSWRGSHAPVRSAARVPLIPAGSDRRPRSRPIGDDAVMDDRFETLAVHAGQEPDELTGAVAPPIYQTSTYAQQAVGRPTRGYEYARSQNPTRERLERAVAALEGGSPRDRLRQRLGGDRGDRRARRAGRGGPRRR